jgi:osmotically-inducible protein OsmY
MHKTRIALITATLLALLPLLQGCFPMVAGGAAAGIMSIHDRRSTGTQTDDETFEWKVRGQLPEQYKSQSNVSVTVFNKRLLLSGEVPSADARTATETAVRTVDGLREVYNELGVGPISTFGSRSNDSYITSKIKGRLVDSDQVSANHIKVVSERGIAYLMGIVNDREAKAAIAVARTTSGVLKVINLMEVLSDAEIQRMDEQFRSGGSNPQPALAPVESR